MFMPWQMPSLSWCHPAVSQSQLYAGGAFPVPEALSPTQLPPNVLANMMRPLKGPAKPAVSLNVMNQTAWTMIAPDLPNVADV